MFHEIHFVEKWGRGIDLILSKEQDTEFKEIADIFIVVFKRKNVSKNVDETVGKTVGKIIELIKEDSSITRDGLAKKTGLTVRGIEWNLEKLKKKGLIKRIGSARAGHWKIIKTSVVKEERKRPACAGRRENV